MSISSVTVPERPSSNRWRWVVLGVLTIGALSVPSGIVILQSRLQNQRASTSPWDDPNITRKLSEARLAKAKAIRADYEVWALKHKASLAAMLAAKGKDFSKIQAVWATFPPIDARTDWYPDTQSGPTKFGWFLDPEKTLKNSSHKSAETLNLLTKQIPDAQRKLKTEFEDKSDFTVAVSDNVGPTETYLWASGRITERSWVQNPNHASGQPATIQLPHKELVPPYDFLTSASSG